MIRDLRQPIARKMPISCVRSSTETIIVFSMPIEPTIRAMALKWSRPWHAPREFDYRY